jgi:thiamine-phosphate pyrophosphorylase
MHKNIPKIFVFLDKYNNHIFKNNSTNLGVIYRNYKTTNREQELIKIATACKKNRFKLFISNDIKLVMKYKAAGVYIPSFNKTKRFQNLEKKNIVILGSAHNQKEIQTKIKQNCKAVFLSPIFYIKKSNRPLDLHRFNYLANRNKIKLLALGGISKNNIRKLKLLCIDGFGGIGLFKKKPAYKRPVL